MICIDVANGYSEYFVNIVSNLECYLVIKLL